MLIFLDFDGVLHPRAPAGRYFSNIPRLETVLRDYQFLEIVISSSWRENYNIETLRQHFSPDMRDRIVGVTPILFLDPFQEILGSRWREVVAYLEQSGSQDRQWLALDDEEGLYSPDCPNLIKCHSLIGLDEQVEAELRRRLNEVLAAEAL